MPPCSEPRWLEGLGLSNFLSGGVGGLIQETFDFTVGTHRFRRSLVLDDRAVVLEPGIDSEFDRHCAMEAKWDREYRLPDNGG